VRRSKTTAPTALNLTAAPQQYDRVTPTVQNIDDLGSNSRRLYGLLSTDGWSAWRYGRGV